MWTAELPLALSDLRGLTLSAGDVRGTRLNSLICDFGLSDLLCSFHGQVPEFLGAGARHWGFMLRGLRELEGALRDAGIAFFMLKVGAAGR